MLARTFQGMISYLKKWSRSPRKFLLATWSMILFRAQSACIGIGLSTHDRVFKADCSICDRRIAEDYVSGGLSCAQPTIPSAGHFST